VYVSEDKGFIIWCGEEDHLRIMCMEKGTILNKVFDRLKAALDVVNGIEGLEFAISPDYGVVTSCPTNLGTGMRASLHIQLPNLTSDGTDTKAKEIAKPLGLSVRGLGGEHTPIGADGTVDISPSARFCIKESEIITALYKGIEQLKAAEDAAAPTPPEQVELSAIPDCIEKAKAAGKGAFFCMPPPAGQDSSPFQTFMAVQSAEVVDGMGITQKKVQGQEVGEIMEDIRKQIVNAMKFGRPLYIDLRKGAPSLQTDYMIDDKFPLEVWDATDHEKCEELIAKIVREEEKESGMFIPKDGYGLVVSSSFQHADYKEFLDGAQTVPWDKVMVFEVIEAAE